jgi:hypothetical protein
MRDIWQQQQEQEWRRDINRALPILWPSGLWYSMIWWMVATVSEEHTTSIFKLLPRGRRQYDPPKHWYPQDYEVSQTKNHNINSKWALRRMRIVLSLNPRTRRHGFSDLCQLIYPLFQCRLSGCRFQACLYTAKFVPPIRMCGGLCLRRDRIERNGKSSFVHLKFLGWAVTPVSGVVGQGN